MSRDWWAIGIASGAMVMNGVTFWLNWQIRKWTR